jgi:hypothetical protein
MKPAINTQDQEFDPTYQAFRVVVGYEDYSSGLRAMQLYNHILELWDEPSELQLNLWKFEPLGLQKLREAATIEAVNADLIILSIRGDNALPKEATDWIQDWSEQKTPGESAIALLVDTQFSSHPNAQATQEYLQSIANSTGIDFITSKLKKPETMPRFEGLFERSSASTATLNSILERDRYMDHWGINE